MCGKEMQVFIEKGYSHKEITVRCGNTSPTGYPYLCQSCEKVNAHRDWRREAIEAGENFDEEY